MVPTAQWGWAASPVLFEEFLLFEEFSRTTDGVITLNPVSVILQSSKEDAPKDGEPPRESHPSTAAPR